MAKKKEQKDMAQEQELRLKFQQKLIEILELGKKKKNMLEYQEIADFFKDLNLDPEKFEMVIDYLEQNGIDVLKISNDDDVDDDIILDEEDEVEVEKIDLSVPEGVSVEDPVRMYLKEIGKVPLLSAFSSSDAPSRRPFSTLIFSIATAPSSIFWASSISSSAERRGTKGPP